MLRSRIPQADDPDLLAPRRQLGPGRLGPLPAGANSLPAGPHCLIWVEEGVVHGSAGPLSRPIACRCLAAITRQNMLMAAAVPDNSAFEGSVMDGSPFRSFRRGFPTGWRRFGILAGAKLVQRQQRAPTYDAAEVALRRPAQSRWGARGGQVKQGDPPGLVEGPRSPGPGPSFLLHGAKPRNGLLPAGLQRYGGEVHAWEGSARPLLKPAACRQPVTTAPCLLSPACGQLRINTATSKPAGITSAPCHGIEPLMSSLVE